MPNLAHAKHALLPLRHIAVYVEQPRPQRFAWVLMESADGGVNWELLQRAGKPVASYQEAMAGGLAALQEMVDDPQSGPRGEPEVEVPKKSHKASANSGADEAGDDGDQPGDEGGGASVSGGKDTKSAPKKKAFFGYGPVR
jgi:hypothetical protein